MEIQWSLVIFTALTGPAGWLIACIAVNELKSRTKNTDFIAGVVSFVLLVLGGIASVTHLSHPSRMLGALAHPTSGVFTEAVLVGLSAACILIFLVLLKRNSSAGARKIFAILAAIFGVLLSFMAGESYMMSSRPVWDTLLLPLGYLGTAMPVGVALYVAIASFQKEEKESIEFYGKVAFIFAIIGIITAALYILTSGSVADVILPFWGLCVIAAAIGAACDFLVFKMPERASSAAVVAVVCSLGAAIAYRCIMWIISVPIDNFFGVI